METKVGPDNCRANRSLNGKSCSVERAETEVEVVPTTRRTTGVFDQNLAVYHDAADTNVILTFMFCGQPSTRYSNSNVRLEIMNPSGELNPSTPALRYLLHRALRAFFAC